MVFANIQALSPPTKPTVYVFDDLAALVAATGHHAVGSDRSGGVTERRVVATFVRGFKRLAETGSQHGALFLFVTSSLPSLPHSLLRLSGLEANAIELGAPNSQQRLEILQRLCSKLQLVGDEVLERLAAATAGFQPVDLLRLVQEGVMAAWRTGRARPRASDLHDVLPLCRPAALAGTSAATVTTSTTDKSRWPPIMGYDEAVRKLESHLLEPLKNFASST